jgi:hypothetical protein
VNSFVGWKSRAGEVRNGLEYELRERALEHDAPYLVRYNQVIEKLTTAVVKYIIPVDCHSTQDSL